MPHVDIAGTRLHLAASGDGPVALFIHGFPLDHRLWLDQIRALSMSRRCLVPDLRGFGRSPAPIGDGLPMELHAGDLIALLDTEGVDEADVVGLSMGGYVALEVWARRPDLVRTLVLADTRADGDGPEEQARRDTTAARVVDQGRGWFSEDVSGSLLAPGASLSARARLRTMAEDTPYETIVGALRGMRDRADHTATLETIDVGCAVVVGERDPVTPPERAEALAAEIPNSHLFTIPDAGHLPPIEQPDAFTEALAGFWNGHDFR